MRTTQKEYRRMQDEIKAGLGLKSRIDASNHFHNVIAPAFKRLGYSLSYHKDGCYTLTENHMKYHSIQYDDLFTPLLTVRAIQELSSNE